MLYSEIFRSIQGEGVYTGVPTTWLRLFGCNLECNGFGQKDPTDPSTYILPYKEIDLKHIAVPEQLPVFSYGCDSSYSWSKRFKKIQREGTSEEVALEMYQWLHDNTTHVAFTGGEPLMKAGQKNIIKVLDELNKLFIDDRGNPKPLTNVTFETNGTRPISEELSRAFNKLDTEYFFSVSPKIWNTSGEKDKIFPEIVKGYQDASYINTVSEPQGQLKFVCNGSLASWSEIQRAVTQFRNAGVVYPIWIMPVGATEESQSEEIVKIIAEETMNRGWNVSARVHCYIWGNEIGR